MRATPNRYRALILAMAAAATGCADLPVEDPPTPESIGEKQSAGADTVCGQEIARADAYWAKGGRVYLGDTPVELYGLNWFGLETDARAPHGLWERPLEDFMKQIKALGFTALRVPLSPQSIRPGYPSMDYAHRSDPYGVSDDGYLDTGREQLEAMLAAAAAYDVKVLLSFHTCDPGRLAHGLPGRPDGCDGYSISDWHADLVTLAGLARDYAPVVFGIDLNNEPYRLTWPEWRDMAEEAGQKILCENPRVLVFVGGVGNSSTNGGYSAFWGENFTQARGDGLVDLPDSRTVYSPHVYGPSVGPGMDYFRAPGFPENMPAIWDTHFGHLVDQGKNVVMGEFCGWYDDARAPGDRAWQDRMIAYMRARGISGFFYWALNPNASDTGGVLESDWRTPNDAKLRLLAPLMSGASAPPPQREDPPSLPDKVEPEPAPQPQPEPEPAPQPEPQPQPEPAPQPQPEPEPAPEPAPEPEETPWCSHPSLDPDGDGWGWEDEQSCLTWPVCASGSATDPDGDGWGWEDGASCLVAPACSSADVDPDGDGWGWERERSCRVLS